MNVSVVIPAYGDRSLTSACIDTVYAYDPNVEVVIVDNDGQAKDIDCEVYLPNPENVGFARACNQGAWASTGDVIVFLNNDTQITSRRALTLLAEQAMVHGVAGCHLVRPDGTTHHAGVRVFRRPDGLVWAEEITEQQPAGLVQAVTAACMAIRRDLFAALEGFDTGFWNGAEDVDLCLRARSTGVRCWYDPTITVVHRVSAAGPERWVKVRDNVLRLHRLWDGRLEDLPAA